MKLIAAHRAFDHLKTNHSENGEIRWKRVKNFILRVKGKYALSAIKVEENEKVDIDAPEAQRFFEDFK